MVTTPNLDLLLRQRTFSIDETREQMQLGRPVLRDAVLESNAVDYSSMMYGDGDDVNTSNAPSASTQAENSSTRKPASGVPPTAGSWAGVLMKGGAAPPASPTKTDSQAKPKAVDNAAKKVNSDAEKSASVASANPPAEGSATGGNKKGKGGENASKVSALI
jgi:hypothetical protein